MKLADLATGPDWIIWIVFVVFAVLSIIYFLGTEVGLFLDTIWLQKKKRKSMMKRSYAEQRELECLL